MRTLKLNLLKVATFMLLLTGMGACENKEEVREKESDSVGILPSSIENVVDVFELKFGELKEWQHNGQIFRFSITDIQDNLLNCATMYGLNIDFNHIRTYAYLQVETDTGVSHLKMSSRACGADEYINDGSDIQHIWKLLETWHSETPNFTDPSYFANTFLWAFGEGTLLKNTSLSLFIAKEYPIIFAPEFNYNVKNSMYKFIFIVTN